MTQRFLLFSIIGFVFLSSLEGQRRSRRQNSVREMTLENNQAENIALPEKYGFDTKEDLVQSILSKKISRSEKKLVEKYSSDFSLSAREMKRLDGLLDKHLLTQTASLNQEKSSSSKKRSERRQRRSNRTTDRSERSRSDRTGVTSNRERSDRTARTRVESSRTRGRAERKSSVRRSSRSARELASDATNLLDSGFDFSFSGGISTPPDQETSSGLRSGRISRRGQSTIDEVDFASVDTTDALEELTGKILTGDGRYVFVNSAGQLSASLDASRFNWNMRPAGQQGYSVFDPLTNKILAWNPQGSVGLAETPEIISSVNEDHESVIYRDDDPMTQREQSNVEKAMESLGVTKQSLESMTAVEREALDVKAMDLLGLSEEDLEEEPEVTEDVLPQTLQWSMVELNSDEGGVSLGLVPEGVKNPDIALIFKDDRKLLDGGPPNEGGTANVTDASIVSDNIQSKETSGRRRAGRIRKAESARTLKGFSDGLQYWDRNDNGIADETYRKTWKKRWFKAWTYRWKQRWWGGWYKSWYKRWKYRWVSQWTLNQRLKEPMLSFSETSSSVSEGSGSVELKIKLDNPGIFEHRVKYSVQHSTRGNISSSTLSIAANKNNGVISVPIEDDNLFYDNEFYAVKLFFLKGGNTNVGGKSVHRVNVINNDTENYPSAEQLAHIERFQTNLGSLISHANDVKDYTQPALDAFATVEAAVKKLIEVESAVEAVEGGLNIAKSIPRAGALFKPPHNMVKNLPSKVENMRTNACDVDKRLDTPEAMIQKIHELMDVITSRLDQIGYLSQQTYGYLSLAKECASETRHVSLTNNLVDAQVSYLASVATAADATAEVDTVLIGLRNKLEEIEKALDNGASFTANYQEVLSALEPIEPLASALTSKITISPWIGSTASPSCPSGYTDMGLHCARCPSGYTNLGAICDGGCPSGFTNYGALCVKCPSGYSNVGGWCQKSCWGWCSADHIRRSRRTSSIQNAEKQCPSGYTNLGLTCIQGSITIGLEDISYTYESVKAQLDVLGIIAAVEEVIDVLVQEALQPIINELGLPDFNQLLPDYAPINPDVITEELRSQIDDVYNTLNSVANGLENVLAETAELNIEILDDIDCVKIKKKLTDLAIGIASDQEQILQEAAEDKIKTAIISTRLANKANNLNERLNTYKEYMTNPYQKTIDSYESTNACAGD